METSKKTERANLERKRPIFFQIGLALSLLVAYCTLESSSPVEKAGGLGELANSSDDWVDMPITTMSEPVVPPPPPPAKVPAEIIEIVPDDAEASTDFVPLEADPETQVAIVEMAEPDTEEPLEDSDDLDFIGAPWMVDEPAEFPGGEAALRKYLASHIRYPEMAKDNDIQGTVYVRFVVGKDGAVSSVEMLRGVDPLLNSEALRVISLLPNFKPARHNGKAVKMSLQIPVKFVLQR